MGELVNSHTKILTISRPKPNHSYRVLPFRIPRMFKNKTVTMTMQTGLDPKEGLMAQALVSKFCFCAEHRVLGTHAHPWLVHGDVRRKPPQYCKALSLS